MAQAAPLGLPPGCSEQTQPGGRLIECTGDVSAPIDLSGDTPTSLTVHGNLRSGAVITGSSAADVIAVHGDVRKGATILGGEGDDSISAFDVGQLYCPDAGLGGTSQEGGLVDAGPGTDTITIGGGKPDPKCTERFADIAFPTGNVGEKGKVLGGDGKDTITVASTGFIKSNQKDPTKSIEALAGTVDGGDGPDEIAVGYVAFPNDVSKDADTGHYVSGVYGGADNDTLKIGTAKNVLDSIDGGPGDDTMSVDELFQGSIGGGEGNDTITATGKPTAGLSRIGGGAGNDRITVTSLVDVAKVLGEAGDDTLEIGSMNGKDQPASAFTGAYASGGDGNDTLTVGTAWMISSVNGEKGDDTISVTSLNGSDEVTHDWAIADNPLHAKSAKVFADEGNDKVTVADMAGDSAVFGGEGDNTIEVGALAGTAAVNGGDAGHTTIDVAGDLQDSAAVYGGVGDNTITVKGEVSPGASVQGNNGTDTIAVHRNAGNLRGDSAVPIQQHCSDVNDKQLAPIIAALTSVLDGLKPVIDKPIEAPSLDIPGDYRKLVELLGPVDVQRLEGEVDDLLTGVRNFVDNDLAWIADRGGDEDKAAVKDAIGKLTPSVDALSKLGTFLEEEGCAIPESGAAGDDAITVDENAGLLTGDGGNDTIKVTTNTTTGKIEGNDPEDETVAGTNQITVATNDGAVNGGGGDTVCTVEAGSGTTAGCAKPAR